MVLNKKGISPLIATVLIIGFTVALAAVIMVWGQGFIKGMQEKTAAGADTQLICAQDVIIKASNACLLDGSSPQDGDYDDVDVDGIKVTIKNDGSKDVAKFTLRAYESESAIFPAELNGITAFNAETISVVLDSGATPDENKFAAGTSIATIKQVEIIPVVEIEGKDVPCSQSGSLFPVGMMSDDALLPCP